MGVMVCEHVGGRWSGVGDDWGGRWWGEWGQMMGGGTGGRWLRVGCGGCRRRWGEEMVRVGGDECDNRLVLGRAVLRPKEEA